MITRIFKAIHFTLLIFAFALTAFGQDGGSPAGKPDNQAKVRTDSDLFFPEVEGWERSERTTYPDANLGYSYGYQSQEGGTVTVYVYNGGNRSIADDLNDKVVRGEFERAKNDVLMVGKAGVYQDVKVVRSSVETIGTSTKCHFGVLTFTVRGVKVHSEIYLFSYKNNFIKIRATRPIDKAESDQFKSLLKELVASFE